MTKTELAKRWLLFVVGLFFSGLGVAITRHGCIGVSPISSVPNIMSIRFESISMGTWLMIGNILMLIAQIVILRKNFKIVNILQIPLSFLFGWFTDFGVWLIHSVPQDVYPVQLLCVIIGTATLGFGIAIQVVGDVILNSGEALVKAIADTIKKEFSNVKIVFDVSCVTSSIIISLLFFGTIKGAREGTIIAAICTGLAVKFFLRFIRKPLTKFIGV
ncbi:MAG: DUF6198 family protein [Saccharofermentans sp.]|nr:DUF6198 family protein [Saccharofermentans sp.]